MNWFREEGNMTPKPPMIDAKDQKIYELEMRILGLEQAVIELCNGLRQHIDRIDHNTMQLDKNMHSMAKALLRPPTNLLGGNQETN